MSEYSVADAKNNLPKLINRALKGERVVITRHGTSVVELRPTVQSGRSITREAIEWVAKRRAKIKVRHPQRGPRLDSGELLSRMRDEDWL